jgi:hypothetical protein
MLIISMLNGSKSEIHLETQKYLSQIFISKLSLINRVAHMEMTLKATCSSYIPRIFHMFNRNLKEISAVLDTNLWLVNLRTETTTSWQFPVFYFFLYFDYFLLKFIARLDKKQFNDAIRNMTMNIDLKDLKRMTYSGLSLLY